MRRSAKVKAVATRVPLRQTVLSASAASRRGFPAWVEADEAGVAFPARRAATPRVRDALVLRTVSKKKLSGKRGSSHGDSTR